MGFLKMNRRVQFQTQFLFITLVLLAVSCQSFKLPVSLRKNIEPWQRTQLRSESVDEQDNVSSDINSISSSPGKPIKFPDGSEITDFSAKIRQDDNESLPYFPVVVFNRNGFLNSKYVGETPTEHGTGSEPRLQRFYKHVAKSPRRNAEKIVFPGEDSGNGTPNNRESEEYLKFSSGPADDGASSEMEIESSTQPLIISNESKDSTSSNKTTHHDEASKHSLESLAQIVRHLLFRGAGPMSGEITTTEQVQETNEPENSKSDVSEQSLYTGPKVKLNSDSDGCSDGLKKTRNGSCQKPSRRLGTG
ncbi:unnamed protein product [Orchesella dallaii]|uniref:Uncharacterized protein n=1 Tax=Orchesella dallaii TaxID=48710 RepID=A0ABP1R4K3_9HEXA